MKKKLKSLRTSYTRQLNEPPPLSLPPPPLSLYLSPSLSCRGGGEEEAEEPADVVHSPAERAEAGAGGPGAAGEPQAPLEVVPPAGPLPQALLLLQEDDGQQGRCPCRRLGLLQEDDGQQGRCP